MTCSSPARGAGDIETIFLVEPAARLMLQQNATARVMHSPAGLANRFDLAGDLAGALGPGRLGSGLCRRLGLPDRLPPGVIQHPGHRLYCCRYPDGALNGFARQAMLANLALM